MPVHKSLMTRRDFAKGSLVCSAGAWMQLNAGLPQASFPTDPRLRIAVATYPFRRSILAPLNGDRDPRVPGMDLAAFGRYIRTEFGVSGIEPLHSHFSSTEPEALHRLRAAFDAAGVRTVNIPVDEPVDLCSQLPEVRRQGNASYRSWIDTAVILGSPSIRVSIPKCANTADLAEAVEALRPTLDYAQAHNVVVNLENDDPVLGTAERSVAVIEQARTPYLRALPDFANGLMGGDESFNTKAVRLMFEHAWNIAHVKDAETIHGKLETVSLPTLFGVAKAAGYRGYYSMESDSDRDPFTDTRHLIEQTLVLL